MTQGLFALWVGWTIASTIKNILGGFTHLFSWRPWKKAEQQSRLLIGTLIVISTGVASLTAGGAIAAIILATIVLGAVGTLVYAAYRTGKNAWGKITGSWEQAREVYELMTQGFEKNNKNIDRLLQHRETYEKLMQNIVFCQYYGFDMRKINLPNDATYKLIRLGNAYYYERQNPLWVFFVNIGATLSGGLITPPPWYVKRQVKKYDLPVKLTVFLEEKDEKIKLRELPKKEKDKEISTPLLVQFKKPKKFLFFNHFQTQHPIKFSSQVAIPTDAYKQNIM
ncbi:MAG: hypothetical protein K0S63_1185 [Gammaproteobacteria bacterium]|nr:hypothetical protein [Gammaproteobacteria bacterium]